MSIGPGGILSGYSSLLALHLGGTPSLKTGTSPLRYLLLDNRLYIHTYPPYYHSRPTQFHHPRILGADPHFKLIPRPLHIGATSISQKSWQKSFVNFSLTFSNPHEVTVCNSSKQVQRGLY